jgi:hypothetical protein
MRDLPLEDHIIGIAKILKVTEKEVMQVIFDAFENTSDESEENLNISDVMVSSSIMSIEPTEEQKLRDKLPPQLWYKFFYEKPVPLKFDEVQFPNVKRKFS